MATTKPSDSIINTYIYLIQHGRKTLEDINPNIRPYVEVALEENQTANKQV